MLILIYKFTLLPNASNLNTSNVNVNLSDKFPFSIPFDYLNTSNVNVNLFR